MTYTRRMRDVRLSLPSSAGKKGIIIARSRNPLMRDGDIARRDTTRRDVQYQFDRWKLIQSILMNPRQSV